MQSDAIIMGTPSNKEIEKELLPLIRVYKDGSVERLMESSIVPPSPQDPETGTSSKDILISHHTNVSARIFLPKSHHKSQNKLPILVYFHSGAFCVESAFSFLSHRYLNILASQANVIAVSVDYRLLPHHPLPAAYEDGWSALQWIASHTTNGPNKDTEPWLLDHADFNKIYVGGDTNGANLAHNVVMRAGREALPGNVKILGAMLCCPYFWGSKPIGIDNPCVNPCGDGAPSLAKLGCYKMLVSVSGKDEFRNRDLLYYESVKNSGWDGQLEDLYEAGDDEEHAFQLFNPYTHNAINMINRLSAFLV